ncbi:MAG: hypothetical protein ABIB79_02745 [archaeon]
MEEETIRLEDIKGNVAKYQGDLVLCLREIEGRPNYDVMPGRGYHEYYHLETGIINENLNEIKEDSLSCWKTIEVPSWDITHPRENYSIIVNHGIPVRQLFFHRSTDLIYLNFMPEELEGVKEGDIVFATYEFSKVEKLSLCLGGAEDYPHLSAIDFIFGERDIRDYLGTHKNVLRKGIDDFIKLVTESGELEKRIEKHNLLRRENVARDLIKDVSRLCELDREIQRIEGGVLSSSLRAGQGWEDWGNSKEIYRYQDYRTRVNHQIENIQEKIQKSNKIELGKLPHISGDCLGFPGQVSVQDYLSSFREKILPSIKQRLNKLDSHLSEKRRKARS